MPQSQIGFFFFFFFPRGFVILRHILWVANSWQFCMYWEFSNKIDTLIPNLTILYILGQKQSGVEPWIGFHSSKFSQFSKLEKILFSLVGIVFFFKNTTFFHKNGK